MGRLWNIVESWRDGKGDLQPSYRKIAKAMRVAQSSFDTWKNLSEMPKRRNLYAISLVTETPYHRVVQAAIDDIDLFNEAAARDAFEAHESSLRVPADDDVVRVAEPRTRGAARRR